MYDLRKELNRISDAINSTEARDVDQFTRFYNTVQKKWKDKKMEWVRFETFDEFRDHIQALLYVSMFYSSFVTQQENGMSEHTGYTSDYTHTYSWWKIQDPGTRTFKLDGKVWNTEESWFEIRQPLARSLDYFEVRLRVGELANMPLA